LILSTSTAFLVLLVAAIMVLVGVFSVFALVAVVVVVVVASRSLRRRLQPWEPIGFRGIVDPEAEFWRTVGENEREHRTRFMYPPDL
jgi:hypothetical protein